MDTNKKPLPISTVYGIRSRINTNPDFQRPAVWSTSQKQLLIDTILRKYDIPKFYWRKIGTKPDLYDVVDGQQRLRAIWGFLSGEYKLAKNADPIDEEEIAGLGYEELPDDLRSDLDTYTLDIVILEETDEDEVREMFLRLQNGTSLKAQEKRNAYPGQMRDFVCGLTKHPFFTRVEFTNSRFAFDHVAAQIVLLEMVGSPTNVKNADLNKMYEANKNFDPNSPTAKGVKRVLGIMADAFQERTPELERYNVISLYCVISEIIKQYSIPDIKALLHDWFLAFEAKRREEKQKNEEVGDPEWTTYNEKISHSTDAAESIRWRMEFMLRNLLETHPDIPRKDEQRGFTHIQKLAIFRRDKGVCQLKIECQGDKLAWDDWHADHIKPWSKGGPTTVENGQVACSACNLAKGAD